MINLETVLEEVMKKDSRDSNRLAPLADYVIERFRRQGLAGVQGGSAGVGELKVAGLARQNRGNASNSTPIIAGPLNPTSVRPYDPPELRPSFGGPHGRYSSGGFAEAAFPRVARPACGG